MSEAYFKTLNYSLANEDTAFEMNVLRRKASHVYSIAGSGARVMPLFAKQPSHLTIVDIAQEQLWLTELRIEAARVLDLDDYLLLFGYPRSGGTKQSAQSLRKTLLARIESEGQMSPKARTFARQLFEFRHWDSPLYVGKWEKTFQRLARLNRRMVGHKGLDIFECRSITQQRKYYEKIFPKRRFDLVLLALGNARIFNRLLYKGHFPRHNLSESSHELYRHSFAHLFRTAPARENYFLQLLFLGKLVHPEGNPVECRPTVYQAIQKGIRSATVQYLRGDANMLAHQAAARFGKIDFVSFSDVPSYFTGEAEKGFMQALAPALAARAQVVVRNYIHIPENLDLDGYVDEAARYQHLIDAEKLQVYDIHVYRNRRQAVSA